MKFKKKRLLLYNIKVQSKAARTDIEAATSTQKSANVLTLNNRFSMYTK